MSKDSQTTTKVAPEEMPVRTYNMIRDGILLLCGFIAMADGFLAIIMAKVLHG